MMACAPAEKPDDDALSGEEFGPFRSVPYVARRLRWSPRTLRSHCVNLLDWIAEMRAERRTVHEHVARSGTVPAMKVGAMWRIPVWWYKAVEEIGTMEPERETG